MDKVYIGKQLRLLRKTYKLTMMEFVELFKGEDGFSYMTLSSWENGGRAVPLDQLYNISSMFGVSVDWFIGLQKEPFCEDKLDVLCKRYLKKEVQYKDSCFDINFLDLTSMSFSEMDCYAKANMLYLYRRIVKECICILEDKKLGLSDGGEILRKELLQAKLERYLNYIFEFDRKNKLLKLKYDFEQVADSNVAVYFLPYADII